MNFETRNGRLRIVPPRICIVDDDVRITLKRGSGLPTVDGRIVRDVLWFDCGYIVVELDGREWRLP